MSRKSLLDPNIFKNRRMQVADQFSDGALILPANHEMLRNNDVHYKFRQDSNFFYLTGFEEPDAVFVFRPGKTPETIMFVRKKDSLRETWDGFRFGPEGVKTSFGIDEAYDLGELEYKLPKLLSEVRNVYFRILQFNHADEKILAAIDDTKIQYGRSGRGNLSIHDPTEILGEKRVIKTPLEVEWLKKACELGAIGHIEAMKYTKPGANERQIEAVINYHFSLNGSNRVGYNPIVASGANACTLHYVFNDQICKDGDLLLIDAGCEWNYFTSDITRTFPVNGKFSKIQNEFYSHVLKIQKDIIELIKPGITIEELQTQTIEKLVEACKDLKLLKGSSKENIEKLLYKKYYPHGVSHWLGMDVHDSGLYSIEGKPRKIEPGMCFTVEPGLYVPLDDDSAPKELRGLGVRIEDNIVVTKTGCEVLTYATPKEIKDIEEIMN